MIPQDLTTAHDDEMRLLGCVMADGAASYAKAVNAGVTIATFDDMRNALVWQTVETLAADGKSIDEVTVASALQAGGKMDRVGWPHVTELVKSVPTTLQASLFIEHVRAAEIRRNVAKHASQLAETCRTQVDSDLAALIDPQMSRLMAAMNGATVDEDADWQDVVERAEVQLEEMLAHNGTDAKRAISWPWTRMDEIFAPMQRGQLIIAAARPSVGKSSLARPVAMHAAGAGHRVYFVTLEVNPERVPLQMAASIARLGLREAPRAHAKDQNELREALRSLKALGITISRRDSSLARVLGRAHALKAQGKLDLLVIDHGLLLDDVARARDQKDQIIAISRVTKGLKRLAGELDLAVLLLWQLNRDSAKDGREPNLADLRGAGSLEEDADKVLFIHRPDKTPEGNPQSESTSVHDAPNFFQNIIQAKGRDDGTGFLSFMFKRSTASFTPIQSDRKQ